MQKEECIFFSPDPVLILVEDGEGDGAQEQVAQGGCGVSILGETQHLTGHSLALGDSAL